MVQPLLNCQGEESEYRERQHTDHKTSKSTSSLEEREENANIGKYKEKILVQEIQDHGDLLSTSTRPEGVGGRHLA